MAEWVRAALFLTKGREIYGWRVWATVLRRFSLSVFPHFLKGDAEKQWAKLRNVLFLTPPLLWKTVCQSAAKILLSAVQFAQASPLCILRWPHNGNIYGLVTTRLHLLSWASRAAPLPLCNDLQMQQHAYLTGLSSWDLITPARPSLCWQP